MKPEARSQNLVIAEFGDELVIYDKVAHRVHNLNRTSTLIWRQCDGQKTVEEIIAAVGAKLEPPSVPPDFVLHGLEELQGNGLLCESLQSMPTQILSRQQITRRTALTGSLALALPVIVSMTAPTPAMALSHPVPPFITGPANGASPSSQFVALSGTGTSGHVLEVLVSGLPIGSVTVDSEGNWEALAYVSPFGSSVTIQVQDQSTLSYSNAITVHPSLASFPLGPAINYNQLLRLRKADIFVTADPSSAQVWFYGPAYTHTALYLGGDSEGTPWVAEAVTSTEAEANIFGEVRSVPLEHSLAWNGASIMTAWRPATSLPGAIRNAVVAWANNITIQRLPYGNIASMTTEVLAADALFAIASLTPTPALLTRFNGFLTLLNSAKNTTTSFICSTLVWRSYWEGTGHSLDISTPNNMTAAPGSVLGNLPTPFRSAFISQLGSVFVVPQTFATSPKLFQIF